MISIGRKIYISQNFSFFKQKKYLKGLKKCINVEVEII